MEIMADPSPPDPQLLHPAPEGHAADAQAGRRFRPVPAGTGLRFPNAVRFQVRGFLSERTGPPGDRRAPVADLRGEGRLLDDLSPGADLRALHGVLQLPHVARPRVFE